MACFYRKPEQPTARLESSNNAFGRQLAKQDNNQSPAPRLSYFSQVLAKDDYLWRQPPLSRNSPCLYGQDGWRSCFERLRKEDLVHYQAERQFGPYWSVTRFEDIVALDSNHEVFSSEPTIAIGDLTEELPVEMFFAMDPPKQDIQRRAVQSVVAPG